MSISKIRDMFSKKGCQVVLGVLGVLFIVGMLNNGTCGGLFRQAPGQAGLSTEIVVATVAGQPVNSSRIQLLEENVRKSQQAQQMLNGDPRVDFYFLAGAIDLALKEASTEVLAKKEGVVPSPEAVTDLLKRQSGPMREQQKGQLIQSGKLKAGAPEADFVKAFKEQNGGKTPEQVEADQLKTLIDNMKDPAKAPLLLPQVTTALLEEKYANRTTATIDQLKSSYKSYVVKRLIVSDPNLKPEEKKALAQKAISEVKAGLKFDEAIKKYGKDGSTATVPISQSVIDNNEQYKFLSTMKVGETSEPQAEGGASIVYNLTEVKTDLPADFEKNKDGLLAQYKATLARKSLEKDVEAIKKGKDVVFKEDIFKVALEVFDIGNQGSELSSDVRATKMKELSAQALATSPKDGLGSKLKTLTRYVAFDMYYNNLKGDAQKAALKEHAESIREVLEVSESNRLRLDLYDNLAALGEYEDAGNALLDAAKNNSGSDPANIVLNGDIEQKTKLAEKDGKVDKQVIAAIKKETERWKQERLAEEKQKAEDEKAQKTDSSKVDKELEKLNDPEAMKKNSAVPPAKK